MTLPASRPSPSSVLTRRRALTGAAGVGLALPVLAACGGGSEEASTTTDTGAGSSETPTSSATSASSAPSPDATSEAAGGGAEGITATADVPVGGGVVLTDEKLVVTQPSAGEFKCFTAVCTHTGCLVSAVTTTINCSCHGSSFDISTGEVLGGPASAPLAESAVDVDGDQVVLA